LHGGEVEGGKKKEGERKEKKTFARWRRPLKMQPNPVEVWATAVP